MLSVMDELSGCDFKDQRLTQRAMSLATSIAENPELSIHAACGSAIESKAAYRFFQNPKVTPPLILKGHIKNTVDRIKNSKQDILVVQDTTDLIYTHFPSISGLGNQRKDEGFDSAVKGIKLHNSIAISRSGVPLGLLKQSFFTHEDYKSKRGQKETNVRGINKKIPIEQKESFRWIEHFKETDQLLRSTSDRVIHVADRECDIFEFLFQVETEKSNYVVRSSSDRMIKTGSRKRDTDTIQNQLDKSPVCGIITVLKDNVSIDCEVKVVNVTLGPPQRSPEAKSIDLKPISVNIVEVKSKDKSEKKLHWRLLTNLASSTFEDAIEIVDIYKRRWSVECFHRILKSGFGVENARLKDRFRIENMASILSVVSWYIFWLYSFSRSCPDLLAKKIFDDQAIKILKISAKKLKVTIQGNFTIKKAILILARLGGFAARKSDGEPGMINIWRGWRKLNERIEFLEELTYG